MQGLGEEAHRPLRIALVIGSPIQPVWIAQVVEELRESPIARFVSVRRRASHARALSFFEVLHRRVDAKLFPRVATASAARDISELISSIGDHEPGDGIDVALALGGECAEGVTARFGVWTLRFGAADGFGELAASALTTTVALLSDGNPIATARVATDFVSLRRGLCRMQWTAARLVVDELTRLHRKGQLTSAPVTHVKVPGPLRSARAILAAPFHIAAAKLRDLYQHDSWFVAYRFDSDDFRSFHRITPPEDRMWADPFVVSDGDRAWIFVEELIESEGRGRIAVIEARADGTWSPPRQILERPYHLSYPCVFRWKGAYYMVPETCEAGRVELYRATSFPFEWEPAGTLVDGAKLVDSTLFEHQGLLWMYTSRASAECDCFNELLLYFAESPLGPWRQHPDNPLLSDVIGGRCGGRPFVRGGRLYRAAQDCTHRYGHGIQVREIVELSPDACREQPAWVIEPDWMQGLAATHTLNIDGHVTVIDGMFARWKTQRRPQPRGFIGHPIAAGRPAQ